MSPKAIVFRHEKASVKLTIWDKEKCTLSDLWSSELGQGYGRAVVQRAVDYVESQGLSCILTVQQFSHPNPEALNNQQLEKFYTSFGFEIYSVRKPLLMIRHPSSHKSHGV